MDDKLLIVKHGKITLLEPNEKRNAGDLPAYGIKGVYLAGRPSVEGKTLVVTSRHVRTVKVVDLTDITHPQLVKEYNLPGHPGACAFWRQQLVIPAGYQGLLLQKKMKAPAPARGFHLHPGRRVRERTMIKKKDPA